MNAKAWLAHHTEGHARSLARWLALYDQDGPEPPSSSADDETEAGTAPRGGPPRRRQLIAVVIIDRHPQMASDSSEADLLDGGGRDPDPGRGPPT